ncbi:MAG: DUF5683 domain-containing protein [Saprospiraceae bacterium]|mgnify:CR=1 FL=1
MKIQISIFLLLMFAFSGIAQQDSAAVQKEKSGFLSLFEEPPGMKPSPKRAFLLSMILPGAGQVYNKKQWYIRAPIAAGLVGGGVYYYIGYRSDYLHYRNEYRNKIAGLPSVYDNNPNATNGRLKELREANRKAMEQALFGSIIIYLLNGIEAFSTAHLINFDVSEDLSLRFEPIFETTNNQPNMGVGLTLQPSYKKEIPKIFFPEQR